jgi:fucose permease
MSVEKRSHLWPLLVLQFGFAITGVGDTVLGPILPSMAPALHLSDNMSGLVMSALFASSACGALLARGDMARALAIGFALMVLGAAAMAVASPVTVLIFCLIYGLGLGLAMTSTSLYVGRNFPERRGAILSLVNFLWSLGAALCPLMVARLVLHHTFRSVFGLIAVLSVAATLLVVLSLRDHAYLAESATGSDPGKSDTATMWLTVLFALMLFLETAFEATVGGWLSTFARRTVLLDPAKAAAMSSFFWTAFLIGRALSSVILLRVREERLLATGVFLGFSGAVLLLFAHSVTTLALTAVLAGFGAAPIFPLSISLLMAYARRSTHVGIALAICGVGGALFPWFTGLLSAHFGSLRLAMVVPACLQLVMIGILTAVISRSARKGEVAL